MNRTLASIGIAAALVCGTAAPALAEDNSINAKITDISSGSSQVSSPVSVKGSWSVKKLEVGQTFTVTSDVINWAYDFPFTVDSGDKIGSCKADKGTLTCSVDNVPVSLADKTDISGKWWTSARLQETVVGKKWGEISIGGRAYPFTFGDKDWDSACDNDCNGGHYEDAKPENSKWGWVNPDGTTPTPKPSVTTPAPNPTTTKPVPAPSKSTEAPQSGSSTPSPKPSTSTTTPSAKPSPATRTTEPQPSKQTKLAKTGANAEIAATLVIMIAAFGVVIYIISLSRKDND